MKSRGRRATYWTSSLAPIAAKIGARLDLPGCAPSRSSPTDSAADADPSATSTPLPWVRRPASRRLTRLSYRTGGQIFSWIPPVKCTYGVRFTKPAYPTSVIFGLRRNLWALSRLWAEARPREPRLASCLIEKSIKHSTNGIESIVVQKGVLKGSRGQMPFKSVDQLR